jgi:MFS family permease
VSVLTVDQRRVLPLIFSVTLIGIMGNALLSPAIPDVLAEFGEPDSSAGILVASMSIPGVFVAPVIGLLADRLGRRNVLVPCLALFGIGGIFAATAPTFDALLLARFVMGFGAAGLINLAVVLIGDFFPDTEERTHWIGRNSAAMIIALAVFPAFAGVVTAAFGWQWALAPCALSLVVAVVTWFVLDAARPDVVPTVRVQLGGVGEALRDTTILVTLAGGAIAFAVMFGVFLATLPTHLEDDFGLGAGWRGLVIGLPAVTSSLTAFNLGRIHHGVPTGLILMTSTALWVVAFVLIGLSPILLFLLVGILLYGLGEGVVIPSLQTVALGRAPEEHRGAVMATWTASARLGQTLGPLIAAAILATAGSEWALLAGAAGAGVMFVMFALSPIANAR